MRAPPLLHSNGNLYVSERGDHALRVVDAAGKIRRVAGTGKAGFSGDGGPARGTREIYVSDSENHRVIRIEKR
jgi:hypothetical protein